jgi:hypothetical protein
MRILATSRALRRVVASVAAVVAALAAVAVVGTVAASPASATGRCATAGHAYLTQPGRTIFSGFEGDQRFGVPTVSYTQGTQSFRLGGNGLAPYSYLNFRAVDAVTGAEVPFIPGLPFGISLVTGGNCVANEVGPFTFTLAPGSYRIVASYFAGNSGQIVNDVVANLDVVAPPPPPPYDPWAWDPWQWDPCAGAFYGCFA